MNANNNKHTKWEYKQVGANFADLNALGGEGWELCNFININGLNHYTFKRPKIEVVENAVGGNAIKHESKLIATINPVSIKVGDWVVAVKNKEKLWANSYLVSKIEENKIYIWYDGKEYYIYYINNSDPSSFEIAPINFPKCKESYNPNEKKVKKVNPKNPNNIQKGDWVSINKDTSGSRAYGAYKVHSVKDGNLTIIYDGKPHFSWKDYLKTVHKVTKEEAHFYRKIF